jgi:hypothetical protein
MGTYVSHNVPYQRNQKTIEKGVVSVSLQVIKTSIFSSIEG